MVINPMVGVYKYHWGWVLETSIPHTFDPWGLQLSWVSSSSDLEKKTSPVLIWFLYMKIEMQDRLD